MISACMIVKNEEEFLVETLPVFRDCFDELIVVDTGSSDATVSIAEKFADKVLSFKWVNDFSAARNFAIKEATQDWIIWIDADEMVKKDEVEYLKKYLKTLADDELGVMVPLLECERGSYKPDNIYSRVKVFRNFVNLHFERAINEQVFCAKNELLQAKLCEGFNIYHWGNVGISDKRFADKRKRNIALFEASLLKNPEDPLYLILIAENYYLIKKYELALQKLDVIMEQGTLSQFYFERYFKIRLAVIKKMGKLDEYFGVLENLALKKADFYWAACTYAEELIKKDSLEEAEKVLINTISQAEPIEEPGRPYDPDSYYYSPYLSLGGLYLRTKNYLKALENYIIANNYMKTSVVTKKIAGLKTLLEES